MPVGPCNRELFTGIAVKTGLAQQSALPKLTQIQQALLVALDEVPDVLAAPPDDAVAFRLQTLLLGKGAARVLVV